MHRMQQNKQSMCSQKILKCQAKVESLRPKCMSSSVRGRGNMLQSFSSDALCTLPI